MENMNNIRQVRERLGMKPIRLATRVGVSLMTIYNWEKGITYPQPDKRFKIAKVLGVDVSELFPKLELNQPNK